MPKTLADVLANKTITAKLTFMWVFKQFTQCHDSKQVYKKKENIFTCKSHFAQWLHIVYQHNLYPTPIQVDQKHFYVLFKYPSWKFSLFPYMMLNGMQHVKDIGFICGLKSQGL